jgi:hypothetical protein
MRKTAGTTAGVRRVNADEANRLIGADSKPEDGRADGPFQAVCMHAAG